MQVPLNPLQCIVYNGKNIKRKTKHNKLVSLWNIRKRKSDNDMMVTVQDWKGVKKILQFIRHENWKDKEWYNPAWMTVIYPVAWMTDDTQMRCVDVWMRMNKEWKRDSHKSKGGGYPIDISDNVSTSYERRWKPSLRREESKIEHRDDDFRLKQETKLVYRKNITQNQREVMIRTSRISESWWVNAFRGKEPLREGSGRCSSDRAAFVCCDVAARKTSRLEALGLVPASGCESALYPPISMVAETGRAGIPILSFPHTPSISYTAWYSPSVDGRPADGTYK